MPVDKGYTMELFGQDKPQINSVGSRPRSLIKDKTLSYLAKMKL